MTNNFVIFGRDNCHFCNKAKDLLEENGIEYEYFNVDDAVNLSTLKSLKPDAATIPQIWVDGNHLGGFDDLERLIGVK